MRARSYTLWFVVLTFLVVAVVCSSYTIRMWRVSEAKAAHVRELQKITTVEEAGRAGWGWTPGGTLIPPECVHTVPNGAIYHMENDTVTLNGKVMDKWEPCPVKGFVADGSPLSSRK
jgi:hypothetical protein